MLFTLLAFALALGVLITFHELGHYWVARRCGVKVLRFSVGFGRVVAQRTDKHGTQWALSAIPLGGYVKMQDEPPKNASAAESGQAFNSKSLLQRSAIVAAGPAANLILAVFLYAALGMVGTQEPAAIISEPAANTPAAQAGFRAGDRIKAIAGEEVRSWNEVRWQMLDALTTGGDLTLEVDTADGLERERALHLPPGTIEPDQGDPLAAAGLSLAVPRPLIRETTPGEPGVEAGLRPGDVVTAVGSVQDPSAKELVDEIQKQAGQALTISVLRDGTPLTVSVTPTAESNAQGQSVGRIGVLLGADFPMVAVRYGPIESLGRGVTRTIDTAWFSLKMMGRMVTGDVSVRNISGPVTIADYAGQTARIGIAAYIGFLALISVSIGVLNLLPIPMLDGGHLMYYAIEAVRGKPVPEKWMETGQRIGLALLAALMSLAFFNDFSRLFS